MKGLTMYRVVLDPIVMLRGLLNPHSICGDLLFEYADRYRAFFSNATVTIMRLLIYHPVVVIAFRQLIHTSSTQVERILLRAQRVRIPPGSPSNMFVAVACAAHADYVICEDEVIRAKCMEQNIPVLDSRSFLSLLAPERFLAPESEGAGSARPE
jgi:predicted nucleic acid-binding protein